MSFSFQIQDTNLYQYLVVIDDEGNIDVLSPDGSPIDEDREETYIALSGEEPEVVDNLESTWNNIVRNLEKEEIERGKTNMFQELLLSIRQHGTEQKRWMPPHRMDPSSGWHRETFIYELPLETFVAYLGDAIEYQIQEWGGDITDIVKLVQAIRKPDGTGFEFSIDPSDKWEKWPAEPGELYFTQDVTLFADDEEFFDYTIQFKREIYDPILFTDDVQDDSDNAMALYREDSDLADAITLLGLKDEQIAIAQAAEKNVPGFDDKPEMDKEGEFGVFYRFVDYTFDVRTNEATQEERTVVIPYWSEQEAKEAFELAESIIRRIADSNTWKECYLVRLSVEGEWEEL